MEVTTNFKKRFCTDNKLSIKVFDEPYFTERLELLGVCQDFYDFCSMIENDFNGNVKDYLQYYNEVKDKIIIYINHSSAYKHLLKDDLNSFSCSELNKYSFSKGDTYKDNYVGHRYISIDMVKANFSSLVYYSKITGTEFFDNYDWASFLSQFTDKQYIIQSKYIRQVVFGACNPKRQVTIEKFIMSKLFFKLVDAGLIKNPETSVACFCSDELVLRADDLSDADFELLLRIVNDFSAETVPIRVEDYVVGKIVGSGAYIKKIKKGNSYDYTLKCVSSDELPMVYRTFYGQPIRETDKVFIYNGRLAKILEDTPMCISYDIS